jgi:hypothetical protein
MRARSNSASAPRMWSCSLPAGVADQAGSSNPATAEADVTWEPQSGTVSDAFRIGIDAWMREGVLGGHYQLVMNKSFTQMGCGFAFSNTARAWVTVDFR